MHECCGWENELIIDKNNNKKYNEANHQNREQFGEGVGREKSIRFERFLPKICTMGECVIEKYSSLSNKSTCIFIYFAKKFPPVQPYLIQFFDFYLVKYQIKIQVDQKLVCLYAYSILYAYLIVKSRKIMGRYKYSYE